MVQKIIGDKPVTDNRQTDNRQTDRHFWADPHLYGKFFFFFFFLRMGGRERNLYLLARYASSLRSLAPLARGWSFDNSYTDYITLICCRQYWLSVYLSNIIQKKLFLRIICILLYFVILFCRYVFLTLKKHLQ